MGRSYPIWNNVRSCKYKSDKSYGVKEHGVVNVLVGSSSSNSHQFLSHRVSKRLEGDQWVFSFYVDHVLIKTARFTNENGRADEFLGTEYHITEAKDVQD